MNTVALFVHSFLLLTLIHQCVAVDTLFGSVLHRFSWVDAGGGIAGTTSSLTGIIAPVAVAQILPSEVLRIDLPDGVHHTNNALDPLISTTCQLSLGDSISGTFFPISSSIQLVGYNVLRISPSTVIIPTDPTQAALRVTCTRIQAPSTARPAADTVNSYITTAADVVLAQALGGTFPAVSPPVIGNTYAHVTMQPHLVALGQYQALFTATVAPVVDIPVGGVVRVSLPVLSVSTSATCWALGGRGDYRDAFAWSQDQYSTLPDPSMMIFAPEGMGEWAAGSLPGNFTTSAAPLQPGIPVFTITTASDALKTAVDVIFPTGFSAPVSGTGSLFPGGLSEAFLTLTCAGLSVEPLLGPSPLGAIEVLDGMGGLLARRSGVAVAVLAVEEPEITEGGLRAPFEEFFMTLPSGATSDAITSLAIHFTTPTGEALPVPSHAVSAPTTTTSASSTSAGGITTTVLTLTRTSYIDETVLLLNVSIPSGYVLPRAAHCRITHIAGNAVTPVNIPLEAYALHYPFAEHFVTAVTLRLPSVSPGLRHTVTCAPAILPRTASTNITATVPTGADTAATITAGMARMREWPSPGLLAGVLQSHVMRVRVEDLEVTTWSTADTAPVTYARTVTDTVADTVAVECFAFDVRPPTVSAMDAAALGALERDIYMAGFNAVTNTSAVLVARLRPVPLTILATDYVVFTLPIEYSLPSPTCRLYVGTSLSLAISAARHGTWDLLPTPLNTNLFLSTSPTAHVLRLQPLAASGAAGAPTLPLLATTDALTVVCEGVWLPTTQLPLKRDMYTGIHAAPPSTALLSTTPSTTLLTSQLSLAPQSSLVAPVSSFSSLSPFSLYSSPNRPDYPLSYATASATTLLSSWAAPFPLFPGEVVKAHTNTTTLHPPILSSLATLSLAFQPSIPGLYTALNARLTALALFTPLGTATQRVLAAGDAVLIPLPPATTITRSPRHAASAASPPYCSWHLEDSSGGLLNTAAATDIRVYGYKLESTASPTASTPTQLDLSALLAATVSAGTNAHSLTPWVVSHVFARVSDSLLPSQGDTLALSCPSLFDAPSTATPSGRRVLAVTRAAVPGEGPAAVVAGITVTGEALLYDATAAVHATSPLLAADDPLAATTPASVSSVFPLQPGVATPLVSVLVPTLALVSTTGATLATDLAVTLTLTATITAPLDARALLAATLPYGTTVDIARCSLSVTTGGATVSAPVPESLISVTSTSTTTPAQPQTRLLAALTFTSSPLKFPLSPSTRTLALRCSARTSLLPTAATAVHTASVLGPVLADADDVVTDYHARTAALLPSLGSLPLTVANPFLAASAAATSAQFHSLYAQAARAPLSIPAVPLALLSTAATFGAANPIIDTTSAVSLVLPALSRSLQAADTLELLLPVAHTYTPPSTATCTLRFNASATATPVTVPATFAVGVQEVPVEGGTGTIGTVVLSVGLLQAVVVSSTTASLNLTCQAFVTPADPVAAVQATEADPFLGSLTIYRDNPYPLLSTARIAYARALPLFAAVTAAPFISVAAAQSIPAVPVSTSSASFNTVLPWFARLHLRAIVSFPASDFTPSTTTTAAAEDATAATTAFSFSPASSALPTSTSMAASALAADTPVLAFRLSLPLIFAYAAPLPSYVQPSTTAPSSVAFGAHTTDITPEAPLSLADDAHTRCYIDGYRVTPTLTELPVADTASPYSRHVLHLPFPAQVKSNTAGTGGASRHTLLCTRLRFRGPLSAATAATAAVLNSPVADLQLLQLGTLRRQGTLPYTAISVALPAASVIVSTPAVYNATGAYPIGHTAPRDVSTLTLTLRVLPVTLPPSSVLELAFPAFADYLFDLPHPAQTTHTPSTGLPTSCSLSAGAVAVTAAVSVIYEALPASPDTPFTRLLVRLPAGLGTNTVTAAATGGGFVPITLTCTGVYNPSTTLPFIPSTALPYVSNTAFPRVAAAATTFASTASGAAAAPFPLSSPLASLATSSFASHSASHFSVVAISYPDTSALYPAPSTASTLLSPFALFTHNPYASIASPADVAAYAPALASTVPALTALPASGARTPAYSSLYDLALPTPASSVSSSPAQYQPIFAPLPAYLLSRSDHTAAKYGDPAGVFSIALQPLLSPPLPRDILSFTLPSTWSLTPASTSSTACTATLTHTSTQASLSVSTTTTISNDTASTLPSLPTSAKYTWQAPKTVTLVMTSTPALATISPYILNITCAGIAVPRKAPNTLDPGTTTVHMFRPLTPPMPSLPLPLGPLSVSAVEHTPPPHTASSSSSPSPSVCPVSSLPPSSLATQPPALAATAAPPLALASASELYVLQSLALVSLPKITRVVRVVDMVKVNILLGTATLTFAQMDAVITLLSANTGVPRMQLAAYRLHCGDTCTLTIGAKPVSPQTASQLQTAVAAGMSATVSAIRAQMSWSAASNAPVLAWVNDLCFDGEQTEGVEVIGSSADDVAGLTDETGIDCGGDECRMCLPGEETAAMLDSDETDVFAGDDAAAVYANTRVPCSPALGPHTELPWSNGHSVSSAGELWILWVLVMCLCTALVFQGT